MLTDKEVSMDEEGVYMTQKEINRTEIFLKIKNKQISQVKAAQELNLSLRQTQRLYKLFKHGGPKAMVSKKRGKIGNHRLNSSIKTRVSELITCETYAGFGPTFMCEVLSKRHGIRISKETTRQLMIVNEVWKEKNKKSPVIHQQRQRRARWGELLQIDGSPHNWFEDRGSRCTLIVFIDDATGRIYCKFVEVETTAAYMQTAWEYIDKFGKPMSLYSDKHGIFRINIPNCNKKEQLTQFGRAAKELEIELLCANSPQAKGRVERVNKTLQDRLVKELRMRKISTIEEANKFLKESYLEEFNHQFAVVPRSLENIHRKIGQEVDLSEIFCHKEIRKISKNLEFQFNNVIYQIKIKTPWKGLLRASITVLRKLDGSILAKYRGKNLPIVEYFKQPHNGCVIDSKVLDRFLKDKRVVEISQHHPWVQQGRAEARRRAYIST